MSTFSLDFNNKDCLRKIEDSKFKYKKDVLVGFCDLISEDQIIEYLACMSAGGIPVFLSHPSEKTPKHIFEKRIENWKNLGIKRFVSSFFDSEADNPEIDNELNISFVQLSSGTTKSQKGFGISKVKLEKQVKEYSKVCGLTKNSVVVSWLPVYHDMGLITSVMIPFLIGCKVIIIPTFEWINNYGLLLDEINKHQGTHCWIPNFAFELLSKTSQKLEKECLFVNCSEMCRKSSMDKFLAAFPLAKISCCYALAENVFAATQGSYANNGDDPNCGPPLDGTRIELLESGKIYISGDCLFDASLKDGKFEKQDGAYYTGDIGGFDDRGNLIILGREKEIIKIHGKQIFLPDVDLEVQEKCPAVHPGRIVSFGVEQNGTDSLILCYEGQKGAELEVSKIVKDSFDVSSKVLWTPDKTLIKTSSGKLSRYENKALYDRLWKIKKECSNFVEANIDLDTQMKSLGMIDSFSNMQLLNILAFELKLKINWQYNFSKLDSPMSYMEAFM